MDLDRYLATHRPGWERLSELSKGGHRRAKRLNGAEIDELIQLYQQASTSLSFVQTNYRDPSLIAYLTRLVSRSGSVIYGTRPRTWRKLGEFFTISFPAAVYQARWFLAVSAVLMFLPALAVGTWLANNDEAANLAMPPAAREAYLNNDFEAYYASEQASQFSSSVYTNNVTVAITAFAGGVVFAIPTVISLVYNGVNVGLAGGIFTYYGQAGKFWGLITPHGLVELTSIVIAGAAGLQLGWALINPGDRRRSAALAEVGRRSVVIVMGLFLTLGIAGFIEGYVTGQPWPTWLRVGIGVVAEVLLVTYLFWFGRKANRQGYRGALGETDQVGWLSRRA